jgi:hypothetical protein
MVYFMELLNKKKADNAVSVTKDFPDRTKHDFQSKRFESYMGMIKNMLNILMSDAYKDIADSELYSFIQKRQPNVIFPNCLLLLAKIIDFRDRKSNRMQDLGWLYWRQRDECDIWDLRERVEKLCEEFLLSLHPEPARIQTKEGEPALLTYVGLNKCISSLGPFLFQSKFHYDLRRSFLNFLHYLNSAFRYRAPGDYFVDTDALAHAFEIASLSLEWTLERHEARLTGSTPQEVAAMTSPFQQREKKYGSQSAMSAARPVYSQTKTMPVLAPALPLSPPPTRSRATNAATAPPSSHSSVWPAPPPLLRMGLLSPDRTPKDTASSGTRAGGFCKKCSVTGHNFRNCPKTDCFQCKSLSGVITLWHCLFCEPLIEGSSGLTL